MWKIGKKVSEKPRMGIKREKAELKINKLRKGKHIE